MALEIEIPNKPIPLQVTLYSGPEGVKMAQVNMGAESACCERDELLQFFLRVVVAILAKLEE